jgi:hypothetical protein
MRLWIVPLNVHDVIEAAKQGYSRKVTNACGVGGAYRLLRVSGLEGELVLTVDAYAKLTHEEPALGYVRPFGRFDDYGRTGPNRRVFLAEP